MESYDEKEIYKLEEQGRLIITRKRDGWKLFAAVSRNRVKLYTDGLRNVTDRLPHLKEELEAQKLPNKTLLVGELIYRDAKDQDVLGTVQSIMNASLKKSLALQERIPPLDLMLFDVVYWDGCKTINKDYRSADRLNLIQTKFSTTNYVYPLEVINVLLYDHAKAFVRRMAWEGLVLYDSWFRSDFRLDGKDPQRIRGCYKWKPIYEDDFIVRGWIPSEKQPNLVKEVELLQIDPITGREFVCGKLGGFTKQMRLDLATATYPLVMQVAFETRFPSGKLRNARFLKVRTDKKSENCVAPKSYQKGAV